MDLRRILVRLSVSLLLAALPVLVFSYGNEPPPTQRTGGFGEMTCATSDCHATLGTTGNLRVEVPATYTPGSTVPIRVTITDTGGGRNRWGFELTTRFTDGSQAGTLAATGGSSAGELTQVSVDTWRGFQIQYIAHRPPAPIVRNSTSFIFTVNWTAPSDASKGQVVFNAAGNAANGDLNNTFDRIYTTEVRVSPAAATPAVGAGGVVSAASFVPAPNNQVAQGQLISIFGSNLTDSGGPYGATQVPLPTQLGPTTVKVGIVALPLVFVSASQINAQLPFEAPQSGTQPLTVTVGNLSSAPENVSLAVAAPGIFTVNQNGQDNGAVLHADFTLVDSNKPARPGETVLIFCTGLGQVKPPGTTGAAGKGEPVLAAVTVTIGGQTARVDFAGLAPGFVGLYQINAVVPSVTGSAEVRITAGTATSRSGVTMPVSQ